MGGGGGVAREITESIKTIGVSYRWLLLFNENVLFANTYNVGRLFALHSI